MLAVGGAAAIFNSALAATLPGGFTESVFASGLANATAMEFAPDGRLFVCQQAGQLRVVKNGALLAAPFLTLTVNNSGERGLLGVAFDPGFATNQFVYVYYTATTPAVHNRVSRFTANGDTAVAGSETVILDLNNLSTAGNHNGGAIHFGSDGKLYVAVGDNANSANAQSLGNLLGKMLRVNSDGTIPADNPFYLTAAGANRAIWALGLRNPFTFAVQPGTGRIFINDVGQNTWEEIDEGVAGANYGWPNCEAGCNPPNPNYRDPIFQYSRATGTVIAGGAFYNPALVQFPGTNVGAYFFADYVKGWIRKLDPAGGNQVSVFATGISAPIDLKVGADGRLYYLSRGGGTVVAIRYNDTRAPQITAPPADLTVGVGRAAAFTVAASGAAPLSYQWRREDADLSGEMAETYALAAVGIADAGAGFRCVVSNAYGMVMSNPAYLRVSTNDPPVGMILSPTNGAWYAAGDTIEFAGAATDAEEGGLPPSAFSWLVEFHHDTHTHPFLGPTNGVTNGVFVIPAEGETAANVWYRVHLTVTDAAGQTNTSFADVRPRTANLSLSTSPPGLQVTLDGQPVTTPISLPGVVGVSRTLGAVSPQTLDGVAYELVSWSDGGAATHVISSPATDTAYTAVYQALPGPPVDACLISRWQFDEAFGIRALDSAGGNPGTLVNVPVRGAGIIGGALFFNGVNSYVNITNAGPLNVSNHFSISLWFKPAQLINVASGRSDLFKKFGAYWLLLNYPNKDGRLAFVLNNGAKRVNSTTASWTTGQWHHVVATYDGANMKLYVNGVLEGVTPSTLAPVKNTSPLQIGGNSEQGYWFPGGMDDVRLYGCALSTSVVQSLFSGTVPPPPPPPPPPEDTPPAISDIANLSTARNQPTPDIPFIVGDEETPVASLTLAGRSSDQALVPDSNIAFGGTGSNRTVRVTPATNQTGAATITVTVHDPAGSASDSFVLNVLDDPPPPPPIPAPLPTTLISRWKFDETSGAGALDSAGGNPGVLVNGPARAVGRFDGALCFNGVNQCVNVPDAASLDLSNRFTISLWFKPVSLINAASGRKDLCKKFRAYWLILNYPTSDGKLAFALNDGTPRVRSATSSWNAGQWYHVAATYDGANLRLYVNGILEGTAPASVLPSQNASPLQIGGNTEQKYWFPGCLDDVRIYGRALFAGDVSSLFNGEN